MSNPNEEHYAWTRYVRGAPENLQSRFLARDTDPRTLIVRVLVAVQRLTHQGLSAEDIVTFLEGSFGAFQEMQLAQNWKWDRERLRAALHDLEQHKLVEQGSTGAYTARGHKLRFYTARCKRAWPGKTSLVTLKA